MIATRATATGHGQFLYTSRFTGQFTYYDRFATVLADQIEKQHQWISEKQKVNFPPAEGDFYDIHGVCG